MKKKAFVAALPHCLPVCAGFLFVGMSYGVYMASLGFSFLWPMAMSITIFAGSMEFVTANLLVQRFDPLGALLLALTVLETQHPALAAGGHRLLYAAGAAGLRGLSQSASGSDCRASAR